MSVEEKAVPEEEPQLPELIILLADDDYISRMVTAKHLENNGHRVRTVGNGGAVLEKLAHEFFDLIVLDVQIPVLDGLETTRAI